MSGDDVCVLAVDVGFTAMGYVVVALGGEVGQDRVVAYGAVRTEAGGRKRSLRQADADIERCMHLMCGLEALGPRFSLHALVAEVPGAGAQGARANRAMGMATGVIAALAQTWHIAAEWVTPGEVKRAATGKPSGSKAEVAEHARGALAWTDGGGLAGLAAAEREHIFDAAGTFVAARDGALVRALRKAVR